MSEAVASGEAPLVSAVEHLPGHPAHLQGEALGLTVALPAAIFILGVWLLQIRPLRPGPWVNAAFLLGSALMLGAPAARFPVLWAGLLAACLVVVRTAARAGAPVKIAAATAGS